MSSSVPARFSGLSYYEVLEVPRDADSTLIRSQYRRLALKFHPDHNRSEYANEEFAHLAKVHETLADPLKRKLYDETGSSDGSSLDISAEEYWRTIFPAISTQEIDEYKEKYLGSEEELEDLKKAYQEYDGDLRGIFESVPFADSSSFTRLLNRLELELGYKGQWNAKDKREFLKQWKKEEQSEAKEAELALMELREEEREMLKNGGKKGNKTGSTGKSGEQGNNDGGIDHDTSLDGLKAVILKRQQERNLALSGFFISLEEKYERLEKEQSKKRKEKAEKKGNKGKKGNNKAGSASTKGGKGKKSSAAVDLEEATDEDDVEPLDDSATEEEEEEETPVQQPPKKRGKVSKK